MYKVLIVEDDPMAGELMEIYVRESGRYKVLKSIKSAAFAETFCMQNSVDIILMDVCTDLDASGLDVADKIKKTMPHIKIIIVTSQPEYSFINRAYESGVDSFWYKTPVAQELLEIMDKTMLGENIYPESTPRLKIGLAWSDELTKRQLEVLKELTKGDTNAEIAERLGLSSITVRNHIQNLLEITGFENRTSLAVAADKSGIVNRNY